MAGDNRPQSRQQGAERAANPHDDRGDNIDADEHEDVKPNINAERDDADREEEEGDDESTEPAGSQQGDGEEAQQHQDIDFEGLSPEELFARVDQDKLGQLQLLKRYHADARAFIRLLEHGYREQEDETAGAVTKIVQLLDSKAKSEVLEAIDFLAVAYQYKMEAAEDGVKAMLHLVWSKDQSTIEEGREVKSVRKKLIESYKQLYFEPLPDMQPKENVSRIARNMIQCVA